MEHPGASPPEGVEPTAAGFTARLERWFAEQGLGRPHVAGNSMGGAIALELARRGAVASATAVSPVGFWNARELAFAQRSHHVTLAGCGHVPFHDDPQAVTKVLLAGSRAG